MTKMTKVSTPRSLVALLRYLGPCAEAGELTAARGCTDLYPCPGIAINCSGMKQAEATRQGIAKANACGVVWGRSGTRNRQGAQKLPAEDLVEFGFPYLLTLFKKRFKILKEFVTDGEDLTAGRLLNLMREGF